MERRSNNNGGPSLLEYALCVALIALIAAFAVGVSKHPMTKKAQVPVAPPVTTAAQPETASVREAREAKELEEGYRLQRLERTKKEAAEAKSLYGSATKLDQMEGAEDTTKKLGVSLSDALAISLKYAAYEAQEYGVDFWIRDNEYKDIPEVRRRARNHTREAMVAYGIFQTGNNPLDQHEVAKIAKHLFVTPMLREAAYKASLPSIKRALNAMPSADRQDYLGVLRHTSEYMATFNLNREDEWLTTEGAEAFTLFGPGRKPTPYRKAEAFVYRRVKEGWKLAEMKQVLDRLIADLS